MAEPQFPSFDIYVQLIFIGTEAFVVVQTTDKDGNVEGHAFISHPKARKFIDEFVRTQL